MKYLLKVISDRFVPFVLSGTEKENEIECSGILGCFALLLVEITDSLIYFICYLISISIYLMIVVLFFLFICLLCLTCWNEFGEEICKYFRSYEEVPTEE